MDREQVIKGMEEVVRDFKAEIEEWGHFTPDEMRGGISVDCDWYYGVMQKCEAGLEMLKRDAPRMLTLAEAVVHAHTYKKSPDSVKPVFVQFRAEAYADEDTCPPWRGGVNQRALLKRTEAYGRDFVFWTDRPSKEQMQATPWRDE